MSGRWRVSCTVPLAVPSSQRSEEMHCSSEATMPAHAILELSCDCQSLWVVARRFHHKPAHCIPLRHQAYRSDPLEQLDTQPFLTLKGVSFPLKSLSMRSVCGTMHSTHQPQLLAGSQRCLLGFKPLRSSKPAGRFCSRGAKQVVRAQQQKGEEDGVIKVSFLVLVCV